MYDLSYVTHRCCVQMGAAKVLRALVIYIMSAAAMTMNLPPFSAGLRLWEGYTELLG